MNEYEHFSEVVPLEEDETTVSEPETTDETAELTEWEWRKEQLRMLLQPNHYMRIIGGLLEYSFVAVIFLVTFPLTYLFVSTHLNTVFSGISAAGITALIEGNAAMWMFLLKHQTQNAARTLIAAFMCMVALIVVLSICYDEMAPSVKAPAILGEHALLVVYIDVAFLLVFGIIYHLCDNKSIARWIYIGQKGVAPGELTSVSETVSAVSEIVSNESLSRVSKETAELKIQQCLEQDKDMSIRRVREITGCSKKLIGDSTAWKNAMIERKKRGENLSH